MKRFLKYFLGLVGLALTVLLIFVHYQFGGGKPYPDLSGEPILQKDALEVAVVSDRPIGNATVSADGRIFFTVHPESNPVSPKLYEWVDGEAVAYPNEEDQDRLFEAPLGVVVDAKNRLWVIDTGTHGTGEPRLTAFDLSNAEVVHRYSFPDEIAPIGSFMQDMQIDADGEWMYIADVGFWAKRPAIIIYNTKTGAIRRVLNRHDSVYPQNYLIRNQIKDMSFFGGIAEMKVGVDGIALSRDGKWLYYGAMTHDTLYRVPTAVLNDFTTPEQAMENAIEVVGKKPLNDGLSIDNDNNVFITDVENQAVIRMAPDGSLQTMVKDDRIRWADGLSYGPEGWLYLADSAIPHLVLQSASHHKANAPYYIWRFKPGTSGAPGQ